SRTADESGSKPAPTMLLELMEELGRTSDETLMVGDTVHDLEMAANAAVDAVAVCTGAAGRSELEEISPVACLESIAELRPWLAGSPPGERARSSRERKGPRGTEPGTGMG
ncbi:MAG: HAD-IA family hydrolase, partial [Thermoanaerobaculia bacterium]|nr:HAD-IA family hydrolase [Thermoanaerobaculia bacterium]